MACVASFYTRAGKRGFDVAAAAAALVVLWPIFLLVAAAVVLAMGRPILYTDIRAGRRGRPFAMKKFRTMTDERDASGRVLPDDQRLTPLGRTLRRYSLDELPELIHVLGGTMSIIGPRPLPIRYVARYTSKQARRLQIRPGLTGLAQARGRNALSWVRRLSLDVWYVDHCSPRLDFWILAATVKVVLTGENVSHPGRATMHEFLGQSGA